MSGVSNSDSILNVTKGEASNEDVAALVALFSVMANSQSLSDAREKDRVISSWNNKERMFRHFPIPGPGAWRASGLA
jgi:hypothetical protein